jgi:hypothetical protein
MPPKPPNGRFEFRGSRLAETLARVTGQALPKAIAGLKGRPVIHRAMLDPGEVEAALAGYVARSLGGKS